MKTPHNRLKLVSLLVLVACAGTTTIVLLFSVNCSTTAHLSPTAALPAMAAMHSENPPTPDQLGMALIRCGLDAKSIAASGVNSNSIATIVNDLRTYMTDNPALLETADASCASARPQVDSLEHLVQSGQGSEQDASDLVAARTNLANALAARSSVLNDFFTAGTASLNQTQKNLLSKLRSNHDWEVAMEFQTIDRAEAHWVQLRNALANERIALTENGNPDPDIQALLTQLRADPTVSTAKTNLTNNLASATIAWNNAIAQ